MKKKEITQDLIWVGSLDPDLKMFDIVIPTDYGTTYNSYILKGTEKNAIFESSKANFYESYTNRVSAVLPFEEIDYIILNHTEPDHTGTIERLLDTYPNLTLLGTTAAINFMKEICNKPFNFKIVKDGDTLSLGNKTLRFIIAPNLHWPDTMFTYIEEDGILVTCDAFGAHYCYDGITNDLPGEKKPEYLEAVKVYYDSIVAPFKQNVVDAIKKVEPLKINMICTGHGPVLTENPGEIVELYRQWATAKNPNSKKTVVIPYVSSYGYTKMLADKIAEGIQAAGDIAVKRFDIMQNDMQMILDELSWADGILLGSPTFVGEALEPVWHIATAMNARTHGKKIASAFGAFGWSGEAVGHLMDRLKQLNMLLYGNGFRVKFKPSEEQLKEAFEFGRGFGASVLAGKVLEA